MRSFLFGQGIVAQQTPNSESFREQAAQRRTRLRKATARRVPNVKFRKRSQEFAGCCDRKIGMMRSRIVMHLRFFIFLVCICAVTQSTPAQEAKADKPKQFIYVLRLVPRLYDDKNWTKEDNMALSRHFVRFQHAIETGELILAGRTREPGGKTFGIAIFEAKDEAAARQFMESDPAVVAGLMTAELHPFAVALERKNP
jgi:uncharacterized protein YciI